MRYVNPIHDASSKVVKAINVERLFEENVPDYQGESGVAICHDLKSYWQIATPEEAWDNVFGGALARVVHAPIAPAVYQPTDNPDYWWKAHSISCFAHTITLKQAFIPEKFKRGDEENVFHWLAVSSDTASIPLVEKECRLFNASSKHIAASLTFMSWIGEGDVGPHNSVIDVSQAVNCLSTDSAKNLDLYAMDYLINPKSRNLLDRFLWFCGGFPTSVDMDELICDDATLSPKEAELLETAAKAVETELFTPYLRKDVAQQIADNIMGLNANQLKEISDPIVDSMSACLPVNIRVALNNYADGMIETLLDRRAKFLADVESIPNGLKCMDGNPFAEHAVELKRHISIVTQGKRQFRGILDALAV